MLIFVSHVYPHELPYKSINLILAKKNSQQNQLLSQIQSFLILAMLIANVSVFKYVLGIFCVLQDGSKELYLVSTAVYVGPRRVGQMING